MELITKVDSTMFDIELDNITNTIYSNGIFMSTVATLKLTLLPPLVMCRTDAKYCQFFIQIVAGDITLDHLVALGKLELLEIFIFCTLRLKLFKSWLFST